MRRFAIVIVASILGCSREGGRVHSSPAEASVVPTAPTAQGGGPAEPTPAETPEAALRGRLVDEIARSGAVHDPRVLSALRSVPRHLFVPATLREVAYEDHPLPI